MESTEVPVAARSRPDWSLLALAVIGVALVLHVLGMFPAYFSTPGHSLAAQPDQATLYGVVAGSWFLVLLVLLWSTFRENLASLAAAGAVGVAAGEIGFRIADVGQALRSGTGAGVGLWLEGAAWLVGAGGAALALAAARQTARRGRARAEADGEAPPAGSAGPGGPGQVARNAPGRAWVVAAVTVTAVVTAAAFVPAWDRFLANVGATGQTIRLPSENAFSGPGLAVFGNAVVVAVLVCLPIAAALLRRPLVGAVAIGGMLVSFVSQLLSAAVQSGQPVDPSVLRVSPAQASRLGLRVGVDLTGWYWADIVAVVALAAAALWLALLPTILARRAGRELAPAGGPGWPPGPQAPPWAQPQWAPPGQGPQWAPPGQPAPQWAPPGQQAPQWAPPGQQAPQWAPPGQQAPQWAPPGQQAPQWTPPARPAPQWAPPGEHAPPAGGHPPAPAPHWAPSQPNQPAPHGPAPQEDAAPPANGPPPPHWPPPSSGGAERSN